VKALLPPTRGYFAIGVEGISKAVNLGNLLRSAHAFGASFVFTIGADDKALEMRSVGRFASRPVAEGAAPEPEAPHVQGGPRRKRRRQG
jgi:tRNA G18 (ribose-2'-O)-methylase SpoU